MTKTNVSDEQSGASPIDRWAPTRQQDISLITGSADFLDDVSPSGTLHLAFVRSPVAHAGITKINTAEAWQMPGVHMVMTGTELSQQTNPQPVVWEHISNQARVTSKAMAADRVRYVGHIVAAVAAETRALAEDAAELVDVDYEPLDVVASLEQALAPDAPLIHPEWGSNVFGSERFTYGDPEGAWEASAITVSETLRVGRQFGCPLETRGCVATWDRYTDDLNLWISSQSPNRVREFIGQVFDKPLHSIRVRVPAIGGGFGTKADFYGEEVISCLMSRLTGRPIKYIEDRSESFMASAHAREQLIEVELGADEDGTIRCMRGRLTAVLGGEIGSTGMGPAWLGTIMMPGPYRIPNTDVEARGVVTNRSPFGAYRGWGQPQGNFAMERIMDKLALAIGVGPDEIRRRNFVEPEYFPHFNGIGSTYDSGRYEECLDLCISEVTRRGWYDKSCASRDTNTPLGIGLAFFVESSAAGPSRAMNALGLDHAGFDESWIRMDSTGRITVYTGQTDMGQGIQTALADVAVSELGLRSRSEVTVKWGDTESGPYTGYGTGGSRAGALAGASLTLAAKELRKKIVDVAAGLIEANPDDLILKNSWVEVRGDPTAGCSLADVGFAAYRRIERLDTETTPTLEGRSVFDPPTQAYPYGCAAALVEIERSTGRTRVIDYVLAHDCGTVLNKMIVDGQLRGGSMQAIAGALYEELVYDENGQLVTTTFMDYAFPTSMEIPPFGLVHMETPSPSIPGGMKGVGEAGAIPGGAAIASAVDDALGRATTFVTGLPITAEKAYWMANKPK